MRFRAGLLLGFGAGYILGARAGRERYEQIQQAWDRFSGSPTVQKTAERTKEAAEEQAKRSLHAVQQGVEKAGSAVKERLGKDTGEESISESWPGPSKDVPPPPPKTPPPPPPPKPAVAPTPPKTGELGS
jgi:hypothetical protein